MTTPLNTYSNLPPGVREYYDRVFLMTAHPGQVFGQFGQRRVLPLHSGDQTVMRRLERMSTVPVPLKEGENPPGATISKTDIKVQIQWYGNWTAISSDLDITIENPMMNEFARLLSANLGETIDEVTRDVLGSTATVLSCSNGSNGGTPTDLSALDIQGMVKTILGSNGMMIKQVIKGGPDFGTAPVRPAFMAFIHTDLLSDLEACAGFQPTSDYANQGPVMDYEWGRVGNARFIYTSVGIKSSAATPVFSNVFVGQEAYGVIHLGNSNGNFYVNKAGGPSDPLHRRATIGYDIPYACRILNDAYMGNLLSTAA